MQRFKLRSDPHAINADGSVWLMCGDKDLTNHCLSAAELAAAINELIAELESLRDRAPEVFFKNRTDRHA
jgi:hypothetical protein